MNTPESLKGRPSKLGPNPYFKSKDENNINS